jgi:enterochelin esterase-like enzyme
MQGLGFAAAIRSITCMSPGVKVRRTQVWLESLGEWTWPGEGAATAAEVLPPSWVPAFPPSLAGAGGASAPVLPARWPHARRVLIAGLLSLLVAVSVALALHHQLGIGRGSGVPLAAVRLHHTAAPPSLLAHPLLQPVSHDDAGSAIEHAVYTSVALGHQGSFYVYLPPGYSAARSAGRRLPVLYLLHGNDQSATAFLQIGLQGELDSLIDHHVIPPLIAVMIQGGRGANNWRDVDGLNYESYVLEVQEMVDRMLPTIASRAGRAIAGDSMGAYGAMELTLDNPYRFSVVESWLGFFNGLEDQLHLDHAAIAKLGLDAFIYGGAEDHIANPTEDAPFAAQLRAEGANATSAIFPGEHDLETLEAHLNEMLVFAGRSLAATTAAASHSHATR